MTAHFGIGFLNAVAGTSAKFKVVHRILLLKTRFRKVSGFYSWIGRVAERLRLNSIFFGIEVPWFKMNERGFGNIRGIRPYRQGDSLGLFIGSQPHAAKLDE